METPLILDPALACSVCGWTAGQLRDTGRMGCAICYAVFESMVAQAVVELHGTPSPSRELTTPAAPIPLPPDRTPRSGVNRLPWPTRRAARTKK